MAHLQQSMNANRNVGSETLGSDLQNNETNMDEPAGEGRHGKSLLMKRAPSHRMEGESKHIDGNDANGNDANDNNKSEFDGINNDDNNQTIGNGNQSGDHDSDNYQTPGNDIEKEANNNNYNNDIDVDNMVINIDENNDNMLLDDNQNETAGKPQGLFVNDLKNDAFVSENVMDDIIDHMKTNDGN